MGAVENVRDREVVSVGSRRWECVEVDAGGSRREVRGERSGEGGVRVVVEKAREE